MYRLGNSARGQFRVGFTRRAFPGSNPCATLQVAHLIKLGAWMVVKLEFHTPYAVQLIYMSRSFDCSMIHATSENMTRKTHFGTIIKLLSYNKSDRYYCKKCVFDTSKGTPLSTLIRFLPNYNMKWVSFFDVN